MMRTAIAVLALGLLADTPALAYEPNPWQAKAAQDLPKIFGKVKQVHWSQDISLWVAVRRDGTDWQAANRLVCNALRAAGKPPEAFVAVSYLDIARLPDMSVIAKAYCEPEPAPAPAAPSGEPQDMGVMGADGVIRPQ